jgi:hypothetical protein
VSWPFGLRSWTVTARRAATAAENRPVYSIPVYVRKYMNAGTGTYKNENPISILLPTLNHLVVLFLCGLGVDGEEQSRAVTEARCSSGWLRWLIPR